MSESAKSVEPSAVGLRERKREAMRVAISKMAGELTASEGFGGWTIEQLCNQVGVSRRTFFNYFPSKEDALVGHRDDDIPDDLAEAFLNGTGSLLDDLVALMTAQADQLQLSPDQFAQLRTAIANEPGLLVKLLGTARARDEALAALIAEREGFAADDLRATVASTLIGNLSYQTTEAYLFSGHEITYADTLRGYVDAARSLFTA